MSIWPVFVEEWQQECCGDDFAIGAEIEWTLSFIAESDLEVSGEMLIQPTIEFGCRAKAGDGRRGRTALLADELTVWTTGVPPGA